MSAMPVMVGVLCVMAIAYRYYSAFLAAKVAVLDDARLTPAERLNDGQNYHPTNKWVLFGHHFAAISGAGPLIGPVLAAQFGYLPGLLWIVIGVCLGGAVQDFLVLVASTRREGRSLAQIAFGEIGRTAGTSAMIAVLLIIVIALAGLGKVVVKALGGESVAYPDHSQLVFPGAAPQRGAEGVYQVPAGTKLYWNEMKSDMTFSEAFPLKTPAPLAAGDAVAGGAAVTAYAIPAGSIRPVPGSHWGTFTIACTIPIALFVGLYMYKIRPGRVVEASLIGAALTLAATFCGGLIAPGTAMAHAFNLTDRQVTIAMAAYGFIASVLPVWVLLCPRDYLSSFLKIGTILLLVGGTILANPKLEAPAFNAIFASGGPTVTGKIFPFLFITVMCGAISGFHALVSSGTTPKMIKRESDARTIGYGAMLIEGVVGVVAMIAAATLPTPDYYAMNTDLAQVPVWQDKILQVGGGHGVQDVGATAVAVPGDNIALYEARTQESLRGRTGGAVTLAVGFAHIFDQALSRFAGGLEWLWKYWYHFAIMFEALFILTTIDTGTRIGRFLVQEVAGKLHPKLGKTDWWPGAIASTALVVLGWAYFINANNFPVIWKMFGVGNQMLAVIALAIVSVVMVREGRGRYLWVTVGPMAVVLATTGTAALTMLQGNLTTITTQLAKPAAERAGGMIPNAILQGGLTAAMLVCAMIVIIAGAARIYRELSPGGRARIEAAGR